MNKYQVTYVPKLKASENEWVLEILWGSGSHGKHGGLLEKAGGVVAMGHGWYHVIIYGRGGARGQGQDNMQTTLLSLIHNQTIPSHMIISIVRLIHLYTFAALEVSFLHPCVNFLGVDVWYWWTCLSQELHFLLSANSFIIKMMLHILVKLRVRSKLILIIIKVYFRMLKNQNQKQVFICSDFSLKNSKA